jgi:hypothetical protein
VGVCVACLVNTHCGGVTPVCSPTSRTCVGCTGDGAPSCPDPERPFCMPAGPLAGSCTECTAGNVTMCSTSRPQCLIDLGICGCAGAGGDSACGPSDSGLVCGGGNFCIPGCGTSPRNGCPTGQTCSGITNGIGMCRGAGCATDGDCSAPLRRCDTEPPGGLCVQCLVDDDCDAPLICEPTGKRCVECATGRTEACRQDLAGDECLANGSCGCVADSDCGGVTSGRVCDTTASRCVPGCRGGGGNLCPTPQVCSSTNEDIGRCDAPPAGDGGVPGGDGGVPGGDGGTGDGGIPGDAGAPDASDASDAAPVADAGAPAAPAADASVSDGAVTDGAGGLDAPTTMDAGIDAPATGGGGYLGGGGGCGCALASTGATHAGGLLAALAACLLMLRRRRRSSAAKNANLLKMR